MNELEYLKKYIHPEDNLEEAIKRLESGEPVQYIVGDVDFYGNIIKVNKNVLIPRRETEELVEKTMEFIKKIFPDQNISILDIGTGDRAEKIRTYNYPQNRVTDHRIGYTTNTLDRVMDGAIDDILEALITEDLQRKLKGE